MKKFTFSGIGMLLMLGICMVFSSCKKYEDGPLISLRSAENRITGSFVLDEFYMDGNTMNQLFADSICNNRVNFDPGSGKVSFAHSYGLLEGSFKLIDGNRKLSIYNLKEADQYPGYGPFHTQASSTWTILKLTNDATWIETEFDSQHYQLRLTRQ